jgi:hypothetical protein
MIAQRQYRQDSLIKELESQLLDASLLNQNSVPSNCVLINNYFGNVLKEFFNEPNIYLPHVHLYFLSVRVTPAGQASTMIVALWLQIICFVPLTQPQAYISVIRSHIVGNEYYGGILIYLYAV